MQSTVKAVEMDLRLLRRLARQLGRMEGIEAIKRELERIRSVGERPTWDLWEGVIEQAILHEQRRCTALVNRIELLYPSETSVIH